MLKKIIFFGSLIPTLLFATTVFFEFGDYCYKNIWCDRIHNVDSLFGFILFVFPVIFILSGVTYKMRDEVFNTWKKFSFWYIPLFIILSFVIQNQSHGGGFSGVVSGWFDAMILFFFLFLYFLISLIIIIKKSLFFKK